MVFSIPDEYPLVLLSAGLISIVQWGLGTAAMQVRKAAFKRPEFLEKSAVKMLNDQHKKHFGTGIHSEGYPDMGHGRYCDQLEYDDWVKFNNAQRTHYNMIEVSGPLLGCLVTGGLYAPVLCSSLGGGFALGRIVYAMGYNAKGANGRLAGAIFSTLCLFGLFGFNLYTGGLFLKQYIGF